MPERAILTYCWAGPRDYAPWQVNVLARLCRLYAPPHRFICVTDGFDLSEFAAGIEVIETPADVVAIASRGSPEGISFPSSYRRLFTFSREFAALVGDGLVLLQLDVDCIPCGLMDRLFERTEDFVGWRPSSRWGEPDRLAGGTWLHRTGTKPAVWEFFRREPEAAIRFAAEAGYRGSDQALLSFLLAATAAVYPPGHGIYQAQDYRRAQSVQRRRRRPGTVRRRDYDWTVPADAVLLHFNGHTKPWHSQAAFVRELYLPYAAQEPGYHAFLSRQVAVG